MKTSKFFLSTLIAASAMTATAYAEIDSELGTLSWTTAPSVGGDFWSGDYGLTFNFTDEVLKDLDSDKYYVLAAYWGSAGSSNAYGANAVVLNYSDEGNIWTLQVGRGQLGSTTLDANTTFTFQENEVFDTAIVAGTQYTFTVVGGNQSMTPTLTWAEGSESGSAYKGNMNGSSGSMNYGLITLKYSSGNVLTWSGGDSGNWSDASWDSGSFFSKGDDAKFNKTATITVDAEYFAGTVTISDNSTLTLVNQQNLTTNSIQIDAGSKLDLGNLSNDQDVNHVLTGTGTVSVSKTSGNHNHSVDLGTEFAGTVELKGNFDPSKLTLGSSEGNVKLDSVWFWGGRKTFEKKVLFKEATTNKSESALEFVKGVTFGANSTTALSGADNWSTLTLEEGASVTSSGNLALSRWGSYGMGVKSLVVKDGATLSSSADLTNDSGLAVANDSLIKTTGTFVYATGSGWAYNTFSGDGAIVAGTFHIKNQTQLVLQNHTFVLGALTFGDNGSARLGTATIGATQDWNSDRSMALTGSEGTEVTTTTFNTGAFDEATQAFSSESGYTITLSGALSGVGAIVKEGAGTLTLSGTNTYTGGTTINEGTLVAANANALGRGSVEISGGQLSISEGVTVSNSLTVVLDPIGDSTVYDLDGGKAAIIGSGSVKNLKISVGGDIIYAIMSGLVTQQYKIFDGVSFERDSFSCDLIPVAGGEVIWEAFLNNGGTYWLDQDGVFTLAIPEPSLFGLLAGLGALTLVGTRRRRGKKA